MDSIEEFVANNDLSIGVDEVVAEYFDSVNADTQDFTYQIEIEPWQIDSTNNLGIYINVDFGSDRHGQVFIHGNYLDELATGNYAFF